MSTRCRERQGTGSFLNTYLRSINVINVDDTSNEEQYPQVTVARCPVCDTTFISDEMLALHDCLLSNKRFSTSSIAVGVTKKPCHSPPHPQHVTGSEGQPGLPLCLAALTMDGKTVIIDSRSIKMLSNTSLESEMTPRSCQPSSASSIDVADTLGCSDFAYFCETSSLDDSNTDQLPEYDDRVTDNTLSAVEEEEEALESLDDSIDWTELLDSQFSSGCFSPIINDIPISPDVDLLSPQEEKWKSPSYNVDSEMIEFPAPSSVTLKNESSMQSMSPASSDTTSCKRTGDVFVCTVCKQVFPSDKYLAMHVPIHNVEHPTEDFLSDEFREQQSGITSTVISKGHKVKVTGGSGKNAANWSCKICNKIFAQNSNYKNHMRTHSDERPYVCSVCNIGFKERYHLKKHQLFKHSSELKEKCRFCGKLFKDSTAVRAHERIHSDIRPYSCKRCGKTFKTSECLWHHENRSKTCTMTDTDAVAAAALAAQTARARKTRVSSAKPASPASTIDTNTVTDRRRAMTFSGLPDGNRIIVQESQPNEVRTIARRPTVSLVLTPVSQASKSTASRVAVIQPMATKAAETKPPVKIQPLITMPKVKVEQGFKTVTALVTPRTNTLKNEQMGLGTSGSVDILY